MATRPFCYKDKNNVLAGFGAGGGGRGKKEVGDRGKWWLEQAGWRKKEEEEVGKVGRVALNNVAIHPNFRVCACFDWISQTAVNSFPFYWTVVQRHGKYRWRDPHVTQNNILHCSAAFPFQFPLCWDSLHSGQSKQERAFAECLWVCVCLME